MKLKQAIRKIGVTLMALSATLSLSSCSIISKTRAEKADQLLTNKYHEDFVIESVGGASVSTTTFTASVYPKSKPYIRFSAYIDKDTDEFEDNYIFEIAKYELKSDLEQRLRHSETSVHIELVTRFLNADTTNTSITFVEFDELHPNYDYQFHILIKKSHLLESESINIFDSIDSFVQEFSTIHGTFYVYLADNDVYDKAVQSVQDEYEFNSEFLRVLKSSLVCEFDYKNAILLISKDKFVLELQ